MYIYIYIIIIAIMNIYKFPDVVTFTGPPYCTFGAKTSGFPDPGESGDSPSSKQKTLGRCGYGSKARCPNGTT